MKIKNNHLTDRVMKVYLSFIKLYLTFCKVCFTFAKIFKKT